jgi:uncharacterized protein YjbI with pentapeptide repeats
VNGAKLSNADLSNADLRDANLRDATLIVTEEHLEAQDARLEGATMPDGSKHP